MVRSPLTRKAVTLLAFLLGTSVFGSSLCMAGDGKLLAAAGLTQLEGSGGGGIVPWATLSGYDTEDETAASAFFTEVDVDDYRLQSKGVALSWNDRVELSFARQRFTLKTLSADIHQNIVALKTRLYGDVIYSRWPQIALGVQHKQLLDGDIAKALGAENNQSGNDLYLAATKVQLGALSGYNLVWNITARATQANQTGLLGYGGENNKNYQLVFEGSAGILLSPSLAVGIEYRQKPDNLNIEEQDWQDVFITYIPDKRVNFTLAYADLGDVAAAGKQQGVYLSMTGYIW